MLANTTFETALEQILDIAKRFSAAVDAAGIPCRIVGGLAVFLHVEGVDPMAARLTRDVDVAVDRALLDRIQAAVEPYGFRYRRAAGGDMFLIEAGDRPRSAIQLAFVHEKEKPEYLEPVPASQPVRTQEGLLIAPVADLVRMKLTSFRLKDKVHIQDLDHVGLITGEIEAALPELLRARLAEVRATE